MNLELSQAAERMRLYVHQLQSSVVHTAETTNKDYEQIVREHAGLLSEEMKRVDAAGGDATLALTMVFLMNEVRV